MSEDARRPLVSRLLTSKSRSGLPSRAKAVESFRLVPPLYVATSLSTWASRCRRLTRSPTTCRTGAVRERIPTHQGPPRPGLSALHALLPPAAPAYPPRTHPFLTPGWQRISRWAPAGVLRAGAQGSRGHQKPHRARARCTATLGRPERCRRAQSETEEEGRE